MKCPNCGMDIVIATHLCPHCGYAHDFDGRIEPRRDIPEPWEITPGRSRRKREREERAASAWAKSRAGRAPKEDACVREDRAREAAPARGGSAPARFHVLMRNLVLASLLLCALLLLGAAALYMTGAYFELDGRYTSAYAYAVLPELRTFDVIFGAACVLAALAALAALNLLRRGRGSGKGMLVFAAAVFCLARFAYDVAVTSAFGLGSELLGSIGDWLIPVALYVVFVLLIIRRNPVLNPAAGT